MNYNVSPKSKNKYHFYEFDFDYKPIKFTSEVYADLEESVWIIEAGWSLVECFNDGYGDYWDEVDNGGAETRVIPLACADNARDAYDFFYYEGIIDELVDIAEKAGNYAAESRWPEPDYDDWDD